MSDLTADLGANIVHAVHDLLPGVRLDGFRVATGEFHTVFLVPGVAAVRIAHERGTTTAMNRSAELLRRLATLLPVDIPQPLGPVHEVDGRAMMATAWVGGSPAPSGAGDPSELRRILAMLHDIDVRTLEDVLAPPHAYAGGDRWQEVMLDEVLPRLPRTTQPEARRRIEAALELPPAEPSLVHGDLAGANMHWDGEGRLVGILDRDLAAAWDPAVDAACLSWHGWDAVAAAVDAGTFERARIWGATFGLEQVAAAVLAGRSPAEVEAATRAAVTWLERSRLTG